MFDVLLISPLNGSGEIYGLSVSTKNNSLGTNAATSIDFIAVLYVILPANDNIISLSY